MGLWGVDCLSPQESRAGWVLPQLRGAPFAETWTCTTAASVTNFQILTLINKLGNEFIFNSHLVISTWIWPSLCFYSVRCDHLNQEFANYGPWPNPITDSFYKQSFIGTKPWSFVCGCFHGPGTGLRSCNKDSITCKAWSMILLALSKKSLPISELKHMKCLSLHF